MAKSTLKLVKATKDLRLVNIHNDLKKARAAVNSPHDQRKFSILVLDALLLLTDNVLGTTLPAPVAASVRPVPPATPPKK